MIGWIKSLFSKKEEPVLNRYEMKESQVQTILEKVEAVVFASHTDKVMLKESLFNPDIYNYTPLDFSLLKGNHQVSAPQLGGGPSPFDSVEHGYLIPLVKACIELPMKDIPLYLNHTKSHAIKSVLTYRLEIGV